MLIRPVRAADLPLLGDIERAAGELFAAIGMPEVAADEPFTIEELERYRASGYAWVATDPEPVAYLVAEPIDGNLHIEQVSVRPDHAGQGIGRQLIDTAGAVDFPALTLTTFRDVPFNAPYYRRLGFRDLPAAEETPGLRRVRRAEAEHGLDRWPRLCMRRDNPVATTGTLR
ncbi:GCN5 family N-acetyltransferase [Actinocatenispora thailandica]|uniref:GCN5 family N-acetyltransferase n=1 Tax=Actinocatenispora thailandica TaxID=227318 RepID=A0A7R7DPJ3_9ACTN|nr:GNAT family N-acetyltransferase [Actinocatenispora thailandica]BCJ35381.1 GCN5 family N-acetyltransferase [Actinocatenispora thailandica]